MRLGLECEHISLGVPDVWTSHWPYYLYLYLTQNRRNIMWILAATPFPYRSHSFKLNSIRSCHVHNFPLLFCFSSDLRRMLLYVHDVLYLLLCLSCWEVNLCPSLKTLVVVIQDGVAVRRLCPVVSLVYIVLHLFRRISFKIFC